MKYRSRVEILAKILEAAIGGTTKTKLMYKAFLSYSQLKEYLALLVESDLIRVDPRMQMYTTTEKGNRFIRIYEEISTYVIPEELPLRSR